ncbi:MAG TPA: NAD(P) transhydrogenase subunit alpha [Rubrobacteraceae bacterium]|nr:NAD(P) transhydrogenase subunit alpha [Rubrobacteraceae bacterium]
MKIGVPKERVEGEHRVALVPETVSKLVDEGFEVLVQSGAGRNYNLDKAYEEAGARIVSKVAELYEESDVILKVQKPTRAEVRAMREGTVLICFLQGPAFPELVWWLAKAGVTVFSVEAIPRISRAQSMDALSAMGSISGYKSAIIGAEYLGKYFPMMTTAAGTTKAAKVLVLGAGVAGLQAVATAKRLGAEVTAFDIRPEVKEQIESLGATFLEERQESSAQEKEEYEEYEPTGLAKFMVALGFNSFAEPPEPKKAEENGMSEENEETNTGGYATIQDEEKQQRDRELIREQLKETDVVITTALVPGKRAPILLTKEMVEEMKPGSVVVDLAAENGGNCELTDPGAIVDHQQVKIVGPVNIPSSVPIHASQLYSRNMLAFLRHLAPEGELELDFEDEITDGACIAHDGEIRHAPTIEALKDLQEQAQEEEAQ